MLRSSVSRSVSVLGRALASPAPRALAKQSFSHVRTSASLAPSVVYPPAAALVGFPAPTFNADAVVDGEITKLSLDKYKGQYKLLLFYPKDFTYVCPTEIIAFNDRSAEFDKINTQIIAVSTDTPETHLAWIKTPRKVGGLGHMRIPMVADVHKTISAQYGVLHQGAGIALRGLFLIDPNGVLQHVTINNFPVGRSVDEALRIVNAFQFVAKHGEVCPADWKPGQAAMKAGPDDSQAYFNSKYGKDESSSQQAAQTKLTRVANAHEFKSVLESKKKVAVFFSAPWCGKCTMLAPYVEELAAQYSDVTFVKFDTSEPALQELAADHGASVIPHFAFFHNKTRLGEAVTGYKKKEIQRLVEELHKKH